MAAIKKAVFDFLQSGACAKIIDAHVFQGDQYEQKIGKVVL